MKIKILLLLILIAIFGTFIYLKVQVSGSDSSQFNQTTRYKLGKYSWVRSLLGLHKDGDAQAWYLNDTIGGVLVVEIVQSPDARISDYVVNDFKTKVGKYLGRGVQVVNLEFIPGGKLGDEDLAEIVKTKRRNVLPGQPNLFVIYADDFSGSEKTFGKTYREYAVVLSNSKLKELTVGSIKALDEYVESILLHEFGHQIGLDHNRDADCIMNTEVESPTVPLAFVEAYTVTDFCGKELDQLNGLKEKYK